MRIALAVGGGIAAYKACEIVRGLDRAGVEVQVLLTRNATHFITPLTLQTLSRRKVLIEPFDLTTDDTIQHIELTRKISALVVAPATANLLAKFSRGIADDLVSTFYVSVTAPVLVAPAMNTRMLLHPATQENIARLRARGVGLVDPESGWLAEGEIGWGRMADPARIVAAALEAARRSTRLEGRSIVISAGPTRERIDPVRFLSNRSSGKMGYALAAAAARRGAEVTLISGPVNLAPPFGVRFVSVETSAQMREAVLEARRGAAAVFMAAAVSDYVPAAAPSKIKRSGEALTLTLDEGPDILAELGREREEELLVGFAAETDDLRANALAKLQRKNADFIVANDVSRADIGLDADDNQVTLFGRDGRVQEIPKASKVEVAEAILDALFGAAAAEDDFVSHAADVAEWVRYLRDIGVRELAAVPRERTVGRASASSPRDAAASPSPAAAQSALPMIAAGNPPTGDPAERLAEIRTDLGECTRCKLHEGRTNVVFGVGSAQSGLMFVGEGPGAEEDARGEPFVGRAGKKLDEMIGAIGLRREQVYIANVVKCRPPDNRDPQPDEIATCSPFLLRQIEALRPRVIVALGSPAAKTLLQTRVGITKLRGQWHSLGGIPLMPTFHPAYLLRAYTAENRRKVWEDLKAARARLDESP